MNRGVLTMNQCGSKNSGWKSIWKLLMFKERYKELPR